MRRGFVILLLLAAFGVVASFCIVILDEREQAFRTFLNDPDFKVFGVQLGETVLTEPGWYVRIPGLQQLYVYDRRRLRYDAKPRDLYTSEKLLIQVDYYAMWRIADPRLFFESVKTYEEASRRLDTVTYGEVRKTLAQHPLSDLLSPRRTVLMNSITEACDATLGSFGIQIADLRLRRTDYPQTNLARVFDRMRTERDRFAKRYRAEGEEEARAIRSRAERESEVLRAEATRKSEQIRGEGDARATNIYAEAFSQDAEFYAFVRSLQAYRKALDDQTTLILSPNSSFLRYLFPDSGQPAPAP
jgi:membrane protease subunit HflC